MRALRRWDQGRVELGDHQREGFIRRYLVVGNPVGRHDTVEELTQARAVLGEVLAAVGLPDELQQSWVSVSAGPIIGTVQYVRSGESLPSTRPPFAGAARLQWPSHA
jgi:hypothetical protein